MPAMPKTPTPKAEPHFAADRKGLAKLLGARGKEFVVAELIQNAWDQDVENVTVTIEPVPGQAAVRLVVEDDDPQGFSDLSHAYTLFAESEKVGDPEKRGRFNLGEKLVLAICTTAEISTTTGTVTFDEAGRHMHPRRRRKAGSRFEGVLPMTRAEADAMRAFLARLIPPEGVTTTIDGLVRRAREPIAEVEVLLPTVLGDSSGTLRRTNRKAVVAIYEPIAPDAAQAAARALEGADASAERQVAGEGGDDGEGTTAPPARQGWLYELGIPVVETGDRFDVDVRQKVPLNMDRDNVPPAYLRRLRAAVLDATHGLLVGEEPAASWVGVALEDSEVSAEAVEAVVRGRFGDLAVVADPSDPEGTKIAASEGYTVVPGGAFSRGQWKAVRATGVLLPAGQVTPSPRPYADDEQAESRKEVPESEHTEGMRRIVSFIGLLGERLTGVRPKVVIIDDADVHARATYGRTPQEFHGKAKAKFELNLAHLGAAWFEQGPTSEPVLDLTLHELGHHYDGDHLSTGYYHALTSLGARLTRLALDEPELFEQA
jgi:hypothetical protein